MTLSLATPLTELKGVGPKKAQALKALGLTRVEDVLYHFPRRFEDRRGLCVFADAPADQMGAFRAQVLSVTSQRSYTNRKLRLLKARLVDDSGQAEGLWFNAYGLEYLLQPGCQIALWGRVKRQGAKVQIQGAEVEVLPHADAPASIIGGLVPQYPLCEGISGRQMTALVDQALELADRAVDFVPAELLAQRNWPPLDRALRAVHRPTDARDFETARRRLAYGEFLQLQTALALRRHDDRKGRSSVFRPAAEAQQALLSRLGFDLTAGQQTVLAQIRADMARPHPMNRLLQGDVGSGKTAVALCAALDVIVGGAQVAFMAPTAVLAEQHYGLISRVLEPLGVSVALCTGALSAAQRRRTLSGLADGSIRLAVGTHALVQKDVTFANLGLAVIDEQHRFGVLQRLTLARSEGPAPHRLLMTATPIPRTLALGLFGDLDLSVLKEKPAGRTPVKTCLIDHTRMPDLCRWLVDQIAEGKRAFWVCSLIEDSEKLDAMPLLRRFEQLAEQLPGVSMALLHGRMKDEEKVLVMERFARGEVSLLVSTTVIEVGVDVPAATVMVIENAERFGLSQLHQLRGRVGRGSEESWCFLIPQGRAAYERLGRFARTDDGFLLADYDLQTRGPGAFCGTRQHGVTDFRLADLARDGDLMEQAREDARVLVERGTVPPALAGRVTRIYGDVVDIVQTG